MGDFNLCLNVLQLTTDFARSKLGRSLFGELNEAQELPEGKQYKVGSRRLEIEDIPEEEPPKF